MRVLVILVWAGAIFVLTCTSSFRDLVEHGVVWFAWDPQPVFELLLEPLPERISADFLLQKHGHIGAFFILTALLQTKLKSRWSILIIAAAYAVLTELLQLFFNRDGRFFDIGFDGVGILLALTAGSFLNRLRPQHKNPLSQPKTNEEFPQT